MKRYAMILGVLALLYPAVIFAEPKTGLGLEIGATQQSGDVTASGGGGGTNYTGETTAGAGIDFQFKLASAWSLGIFAEAMNSTSYSCTGCGSGQKVSSWVAGLEGRLWFNTVFIGLRGMALSETFDSTGGNSQTGNGAAGGVTAGWEGASGVFVKFVYDSGTATWTQSGSNLSDAVQVVRLFVGYRF